jgi:hypothetical protein
MALAGIVARNQKGLLPQAPPQHASGHGQTFALLPSQFLRLGVACHGFEVEFVTVKPANPLAKWLPIRRFLTPAPGHGISWRIATGVGHVRPAACQGTGDEPKEQSRRLGRSHMGDLSRGRAEQCRPDPLIQRRVFGVVNSTNFRREMQPLAQAGS